MVNDTFFAGQSLRVRYRSVPNWEEPLSPLPFAILKFLTEMTSSGRYKLLKIFMRRSLGMMGKCRRCTLIKKRGCANSGPWAVHYDFIPSYLLFQIVVI
ncbi:UNVERIFIED_CONTAM: hypothetical protein PYX00_001505 [Menopon gallinae]|uniref:Uncharacterized protein n=1 Tax=Menopon gallinae TaxID=328185 RepID=A0AAW2ICW7_9NEOP